MAQRRLHKLLEGAVSASVAGSARADYRFDDGGHQRTVWGAFTSGKVNLYIYPDAEQSIEHLVATVSTGSDSYSSDTNSFVEVINGPFYSIEARTVTASATTDVFAFL